ncbi:unnamed protein product [Leptidea sinapis]|uniref:Uncharacterized protein n=1 Tax=Leptidea sinapis TaxID=189913 RepID=A0A5E4QTA7_9NEOP|nr:unnamed protein product [Leptidea sinapis]
MEEVYTIKVKTKQDTRNLYPSERRYSASTVSGLAFIHILLAVMFIILACLAAASPNTQPSSKSTELDIKVKEYHFIILLTPSLLSLVALIAGLTAKLASARWYVDRNIRLLFAVSILSTLISLFMALTMLVWIITTTNQEIQKDLIFIKYSEILDKNDSYIVIPRNLTETKTVKKDYTFLKLTLAVNIFVAALIEFVWSLICVKVSYRGMLNVYNCKDDNDKSGSCVQIIKTVKGNNLKKVNRNGNSLHFIDYLHGQYSNEKTKKVFLVQGDNGFYLKNQSKNIKNNETNSEIYKERMMSFLNRCGSDGVSNLETPSVMSEGAINRNEEVIIGESKEVPQTPVSWDDSVNSVYNQNNLNFDKIFSLRKNTTKAES